jgi:Fe-S cluster biosynthesis and repair protein YggX
VATITCSRCNQQRDSLERAPISGALGQSVLEHTCGECWSEWREESVRIINHYGLQPIDPAHRARLYEYMREFLKIE